MMFDWDDQDQVGETEWGEFKENVDHIVPYTKDSEVLPIFSFEECSKKRKNNDTNTIQPSTGQSSESKNAFPDTGLKNRSSPNANEDHSGSRPDMGPWPDLATLNTELNTGELSSLNKSFHLAAGTVTLDGESEFFSNVREEKENDSFLNCDWANIGDFDDLDRIFRNESIFGHDMATNVDEFLFSSADMAGDTVQPIPMPDIPLSRDLHFDQGSSSFQFVEHSGEKRKSGNKTADTVETREQNFDQITQSNQMTETDDRKTKLLKSRQKAEERSKNKASQILDGHWPQHMSHNQPFLGQNMHPFVVAPVRPIPSPGIGQQSKVGDAVPVENIGSYAQFMYPQYGYPVYPFPGIPLIHHVQADMSGNSEGPSGHNSYHVPLKCSNSSSMGLEVQSMPLDMIPQEKIEKLKLRQQAHAMLAIQQQHQQFGHQIIGAENCVSHRNKTQDASNTDLGVEENENKLLPSAQDLLLEHNGSQRISTFSDDNSLEETIYYQLQEALRKLDNRVRLCVRDSLFRLASSSSERQNASDGSSTNKTTQNECEVPVNEESSSGKRPTRLPGAETYTNPIDRTVAHLLFHRPLKSRARPVNDEMLPSPSSNNLISNPPANAHGSTSEREPESFGEMELQPA